VLCEDPIPGFKLILYEIRVVVQTGGDWVYYIRHQKPKRKFRCISEMTIGPQ